MAVTFVLRGRLKGDRASAEQILHQRAMAMKEAAVRAGDLHHVLYLSGKDPSECVIIDTWQSSDQFYAFIGSQRFKESSGQIFEGELEVEELVDPGWNKW